MERMSEEDEAALLSAAVAEREIERIRRVNAEKALRPSREDCLYCGDEIPLARQQAVPGCEYCVEHQDMFDKSFLPPAQNSGIFRFS